MGVGFVYALLYGELVGCWGGVGRCWGGGVGVVAVSVVSEGA